MDKAGHRKGAFVSSAVDGISQGNSSVKTACSIITAPRQRAATVQVGLPVRLACFYLGVSVPVLPCCLLLINILPTGKKISPPWQGETHERIQAQLDVRILDAFHQ
jgi:hypothetical protein